MAEKRVIEYEAASELANDDWLLIDGVTEGTRKARPNVVTAELGAQVTNLASTVGGLTQVAMGHEQSFAPSYDESESYDVGDLVMQYHGLYKCTAPTTGTWDAGKWARTEVSEQLEESGKIDDVQVNGVSVVTDKVASIDLTGMQADIDSKQADTKIGGASILDEDKVANLDFLASYGEASGSIASFNDGAAMPLKSLKVGIEAVQDLHGYDSPWVGGAGKNKFNCTATTQTKNQVTFTINDDGTVSLSGTASATASVLIGYITLSAGTYILSGGVSDEIYLNIQTPVYYSKASETQFTVESETNFAMFATVYQGVNATGKVFKPMIRLSTVSDGTYAPYENKCPISGWSAVNVYDTGINIWDEDWEVGTYNLQNGEKEAYSNYFRNKNFIGIHPNTEYCAVTSNQQIYILFYDMNHNYISYRGGGTFTTPINAYYMNFVITTRNSYNPNENPISINYPSTDTDYHAYSGTTYTTQLKDGQGNPMTCYGGTLTNENGVQRLTNSFSQEIDMGDLQWTYDARFGGFRSSKSDYKKVGGTAIPNIICSEYKTVSVNYFLANTPNNAISFGIEDQYDNNILVRNTDYTTATDFKTAVTGCKLIYELATPQTIPQDNLAIATQEGTNNLWADSGDVLECKYVRDNSAVINDLIARVTALENA